MGDLPSRVPKRVSGWKVFGLISAVLALLLVTYALYVHAVADRRWQEMQGSLKELRSAYDLRTGPRPVLRGTAVPGNAWKDYSPALTTMKSAPSAVLRDYLDRTPKADRTKLEAALATHRSALDGLRKGVMRANGAYPLKCEDGFLADIPGLLQSQNLTNLAVCRSRLLIEEGKSREAAELLLDTCQFAHDLGANQMLICEMISNALYGIALEDLRDLVLHGSLSGSDLAEIARELEILDRFFPKNGDSLLNEAMLAGYSFLKADGSPRELYSGVDGRPEWDYFVWRSLLPQRLIGADAFFTELDYMKRFAEADEQSWGTSRAVVLKSQAEMVKLKNPVSRVLLPGLTSTSQAGRDRRTQLRLLRIAAQYRATGEVLQLDDPFGAKLLNSVQGQTLKVWSVGSNGVDDGGRGDWKPARGPDIVLDVNK